jgi:TRIAD3 protein (E3 ubiquitin-protein ligase RNF216)
VVYVIDDGGDTNHREAGGGGDDDDDDDPVVEVDAPPENRVLEVFPDAARDHVATLLARYGGSHDHVVAHLIDNPSYPRTKRSTNATGGRSPGRPRKEAAAPDWASGSVSVHREAPVGRRTWTHDYSSAASFVPTRGYVAEAVNCLYAAFPFLSKAGAKALLQASSSRYAIAHDRIVRVLRGAGTDPSAPDDADQLDRYQNAMAARRLGDGVQRELQKLAPAAGAVSVVMRTSARSVVATATAGAPPAAVDDAILREELEYVEHKLRDWVQATSAKRERKNKKDKAQKLGTAMECACCFDEFDIDDMVSCKREGHLFCVDCLQKFASTKIFSEGNLGIDNKTKEPSLDLTCFHADGCDSPFERIILVKALTSDTLRMYDEIQATLTISKAGLSDLVKCPRCGFQATLAATQTVFECPCDDCRYASCRECGEAGHAPLRYVPC